MGHCISTNTETEPDLPSTKPSRWYGPPTGRCNRVIDGDTIEMYSKVNDEWYTFTVRILHIDAPEVSKKASKDEVKHGEASTQALKNLINYANKVEFIRATSHGTYGNRILGDFRVTYPDGSILASEWMVWRGFARKYNMREGKKKIDYSKIPVKTPIIYRDSNGDVILGLSPSR